jgi:hypothetical protein
MEQDNYELIPHGHPINKSSIQMLLNEIRAVWKGKNLIHRVEKLLPVDPSSACQRLFNAAIHDLKEKIIIIGIDLAKEVASNYKLPSIVKEEDILEYNVSKTIDLAYRIGILSRPEWRRIHRCYEIRRDLEHEDNEYEAVIEDCFYIFKSSIDIILSRDPIELLKVTDVKVLIEIPANITISEEFLQNYKSAPKLRQKEINALLVSYAYDQKKPDIVRENSIELMRHIKPLTINTVTIEIASIIEEKLTNNKINIKAAKIGNACGAIAYFKKVRLKDFYINLFEDLQNAAGTWKAEAEICSILEDVGGLQYCPKDLYKDYLKKLVQFYIGEPSYGINSQYRRVFYSNSAAPIIKRIILGDSKNAATYLEDLRKDKAIKASIGNTYVSRRFETLIDLTD